MGVLPRFSGVVAHDRYAPYWRLHQGSPGHLQRPHPEGLAAVAEVDRFKPWANSMVALLVDTKRRCDRAREQGWTELPSGQRRHVRDRYAANLADYYAANTAPAGGWPKGSYARCRQPRRRPT